MVSAAGGIDIEEVAAQTPDKLHRLPIDPRYGLMDHQALGLGFTLFRDAAQARAAADVMKKLAVAFYGVGAPPADSNPLVPTPAAQGPALHPKIVLADNQPGRAPDAPTL